ncbi:MAG: flavin reductase family protein [Firmicutes bacterium]|nr:flavin reductase family protein [Bacillota bacterium]
MIKELSYNNQYLPRALEQLSSGAFLTTRLGEAVNTMTIGWGTVGFIWQRPIFIVAVRYSRHTYEMIDRSGEFTVSFPLDDSLKKKLIFCGTRSGRDIDKFQECKLTPRPGLRVKAPVIGECPLHYEAKVVYKQAMEPALIDRDIDRAFYATNDFHVLYYGEIVACYMTESRS